MPDTLELRRSSAADHAAIESLYPAAFPDEDLVPLVAELLQETDSVISLVATSDLKVVGNVIFTRCGVEGTSLKAALLAPLAVAPARQRSGIGSALVRAGVEELGAAGTDIVLVLGDPAYYGRLGFVPEELVEPPYRLPAEWAGAWQSLVLTGAAARRAGMLAVPAPWRRPALWAP